MLDAVFSLDSTLFALINQQWRNKFFDAAMPMFSNSLLFWSLTAGGGLAWYCMRYHVSLRRLLLPLLLLGLCAGTADTTANLLRDTVVRPRPLNSLPGVYYEGKGEWLHTPLDFTGRKSNSDSFISGHAANSMAVAAFVSVLIPPAAPLAYSLSGVVGYSRVYNGKHFPTDILFGWLAGWLIGKIYGKLYTWLADRLKVRLPRGIHPREGFSPVPGRAGDGRGRFRVRLRARLRTLRSRRTMP